MLLDLKWDSESQYLVGPAKSGIFFVLSTGPASFKFSKASGFGKGIQGQPTLCVTFMGQEILVGAIDGKIFRFKAKSNNVSSVLDGHKAAVNTMFTSKNGKGFVSGGNDGIVIVWDDSLTKKRVIDLTTVKEFLIQNPRVRAVAESSDGKKIVIGTRSSNIIEVDPSGTLRCVNNGHFDKELWGLAVIPRSDEYITVGEDFLMAKWSLKEKRMIKSAKLPFMATVCDVSKDCKYVAVGCMNGQTLIFDVNSFSQAKAITESKKQISELKFSPDCKMLAIGSHDTRIRVYSTNGFKLLSEFKGHHATITHLDWSLDSQVVMSNCMGYEILFFTAASGKQNPSGASAYRDEKWDNWTCTLGWPVQGIYPAFTDGGDVKACCRNQSCTVIATSDDFGKVNLYRYPSYIKKAAHNSYAGHSSHVTNVRFSANEDYIISTGGNDKATIQWKFIDHKIEAEEEESPGETDQADFDPNEFKRDIGAVDKFDGQKKEVKEAKPIESLGEFAEEDLGEGDQAMATLPFLGEVKNSTPTGWVNPPRCADPPEGNLTLKHAFGFRCWDAKDSCKFTSKSNEVAFITAALGVTMNTGSYVQSFFNKHDEDLISFDISPCKKYCATGQMPMKGKSKLIDCFVWNTETKEALAKLTGFHRGGIKHVKFSPSSQLLLTIGLDDDNSLAIYDWQNKKLLCSSKVDKSEVFDCAWQDDNNFATITKDSIKFWTAKGGSCSGTKGAWGKDTKGVLASCIFIGNICFTGTWKGEIVPWQGGSKGKSVDAHPGGGVFVLHYDQKKNLLYSGGKDGNVNTWTVTGSSIAKKEQVINREFMYNEKGIICNSGIRAIDTHPDGSLLVGSKDGYIFTKSVDGNYNTLIGAHYSGEVWGLACHPTNPLFVTCGGDYSIRMFNAADKVLENLYFHTCDARGLDWSPDGNWIVVASVKGEILLFDSKLETPQIVQSSFTHDGKQWIEDIKFSPDSRLVAFGAHGGASKLEIMHLNNGKLEKGTVFGIGFTSALLHLDWSSDSCSIVSNSQAYELKFVNVNGKKNMAASASKDIDWSTWTCKIGFPVQGIFETVMFSDINTVCRAQNKRVLATGDDFQKVRLLKYPSVVPKSGAKSYTAHSSHVTRVRFCCNDNLLITIGGNDKTALVWTTDFGGESPSKAQIFGAHAIHGEEEPSENEILGIFKSEKPMSGDQSAPPQPDEHVENVGDFQEENMGEGDQFGAVLPWLGAIKPPTNYDPKKANPAGSKIPKVKLTLEHVHGYRAQDKRNNIFILASGEVAYHAAAVGIVHDVKKNQQRIFIKHTDKILSMAMHPDRKTIATGENGRRPVIYIWDSATLAVLFKVSGAMLEKSVDNLSYSPSGKFLVANAADDDHKMAIIDSSGKIIASEKGGREVILGIAWKNDTEYFTVGIKHFTNWVFSGSAIKGTKGKFTGGNALVSVAVVKQNGDVVCGSATGELQIWKGSSCTQVIQNAHKGMVDGLFVASNSILTGGKDGRVQIWSLTYQRISNIDFNSVTVPTPNGHIRAIFADESSKKIVVGLYCNEIHIADFNNLESSSKWEHSTPVVQGHYSKNLQWNNEVWGLAVMPNPDTYMTCSDDGTLRMWSISQRRCVLWRDLNVDQKGILCGPNPVTKDLQDCSKLRSVDVHPTGSYALVGSADGTMKLVALSRDGINWKFSFKHHDKWVQDIKFSPDGNKFATGSHDSCLNIYQTNPFKLTHKVKKNSSAVLEIDWSLDSQSIHTTSQSYELLFFNANTGTQVTSGATAFRDEDWATWTSKLGWPVQSIWRSEYKGSDIDAVVRSKKSFDTGYRLLAVATDFKKIQLYKYPVLVKNSECYEALGHGSHVTNVKFSNDDSYLLSTGGEDQCVMQWRVEPL